TTRMFKEIAAPLLRADFGRESPPIPGDSDNEVSSNESIPRYVALAQQDFHINSQGLYDFSDPQAGLYGAVRHFQA
ncbi:MAG: hypothetical protein O3A84_17130, partial [Proteobacteria bacterium]|nr:hypothetical protein [Pseudomonadota bacterium]